MIRTNRHELRFIFKVLWNFLGLKRLVRNPVSRSVAGQAKKIAFASHLFHNLKEVTIIIPIPMRQMLRVFSVYTVSKHTRITGVFVPRVCHAKLRELWIKETIHRSAVMPIGKGNFHSIAKHLFSYLTNQRHFFSQAHVLVSPFA